MRDVALHRRSSLWVLLSAGILGATACATAASHPAGDCQPPGTPEVRIVAERVPGQRGPVVLAAADPRMRAGVRVSRVLQGELSPRYLTLAIHSRAKFDVRWPSGPRTVALRWRTEACAYEVDALAPVASAATTSPG